MPSRHCPVQACISQKPLNQPHSERGQFFWGGQVRHQHPESLLMQLNPGARQHLIKVVTLEKDGIARLVVLGLYLEMLDILRMVRRQAVGEVHRQRRWSAAIQLPESQNGANCKAP